MLSIDQSPDRGAGIPATSFSLDGSNIRFAIDAYTAVTMANSVPTRYPSAGRGRKAGRYLSNSGVPPKGRHGSTRRRIAHNS